MGGLGEIQNGKCFGCTRFAFPSFLIFWSVFVGGCCELSECWGVLDPREWLWILPALGKVPLQGLGGNRESAPRKFCIHLCYNENSSLDYCTTKWGVVLGPELVCLLSKYDIWGTLSFFTLFEDWGSSGEPLQSSGWGGSAVLVDPSWIYLLVDPWLYLFTHRSMAVFIY